MTTRPDEPIARNASIVIIGAGPTGNSEQTGSSMRRSLVAGAAVLLAFTTLSGPVAHAGTSTPAITGSWAAPFSPPGANTGAIGVHSVVLNTGKVLLFGPAFPTRAYVYDPIKNTSVEVDPGVNTECAAVVPLSDGRILMVGGIASGNVGIKNILLFDPVHLTWTPQPETPIGRYYPTATRLADGRVVISGGTTTTGAPNDTVEVYTPPAIGANVGSLTRVSDHHSNIFPRQWLMPDGKVLEVMANLTFVLDPKTWLWTKLPSPADHGSGQTAWLLPGGPAGSTEAIMAGGTSNTSPYPANRIVQEYDYATPTVGWKTLTSLPQSRGHMAGVITPDGNLLGIGGIDSGLFVGPEYAALKYDPAANTWTTLASQATRRGYHSTAVLLPDGRVLSAGDTGVGGGGNLDELLSPPYLFQGARPAMSAVPVHIAHGKTFTITTADVNGHLVLMAPGASTHTTDMDTRMVTLASTAGTGSLTAMVPANANITPKGWYELWLVSPNGVPSTASWVHID